MHAQETFGDLARHAGIRLNGDRPWDITIHDDRTYARVLRQGTLGLGEAYMDGWWDCESIDELAAKALAEPAVEKALSSSAGALLHTLVIRRLNRQTFRRSPMVAEQHYDGDRAMFEAMLDPYMQYSCGYWENAANLAEAQEAKMDLICRKLGLRPGMRVLDIGCGWGGLARYMAERHGVEVTGINISTEQLAYAREHAGDLPVIYVKKDYRELEGTWDRLVSVGMFEHVGRRNYRAFFETARRCLAPDGLFLLHTIGSTSENASGSDPWLEKYIFPNGMLPSPMSTTEGMDGLFVLEDWHNFGAYYDKTAMAWHRNLEEWYKADPSRCAERRYRMFTYYLQSCAGAFRCRSIQLWQLVLSPGGAAGGYTRPR